MKSYFSLKGGSLIGTLLLSALTFGANYDASKDRYVPILCPLSTLHIVDWGKCRAVGDAWDCPAAHIEFRTDCLAKPGKGKVQLRLNVDHPTVMIKEVN